MPTLADLTTLRVGGPARRVVDAASGDELVDVVARADRAGEPLLVLGGGSNLLVADAGFDGVVVRDRREGEPSVRRHDHGVDVRAHAGQSWDELVAWCVGHELAGISALSGIPGSVGATPVQNVGAYGQEVADVLVAVEAWDRRRRRRVTLRPRDLAFGYRDSALKQSLRSEDRLGATPRWVVLDVTMRLREDPLGRPIAYGQLADALGASVGERRPVAEVRDAVVGLRRSKGMVLDAEDHDTWSAGSFFTNPILAASDAHGLPPAAPRFDQADGRVKTSAAWLIQHAGFGPGHGMPGPAALSTKHTLAVTNRGSATAADLVALARTVRDGVEAAFSIRLEPEPLLVGVGLD